MARDLLLHYGEGVAVARATIDVDLAFAVAHWEQFAMLRHALVDSGRFSPYPAVAHRLFHLGKLAIDLIPFGGVEDATGRIRWPGDDSLMRVLGYREAAATATLCFLRPLIFSFWYGFQTGTALEKAADFVEITVFSTSIRKLLFIFYSAFGAAS